MSLGRRLGRLARGFVSNINDERLKETIRTGRERGETLRDAFGAAWRGAAEEWRSAAEERAAEEAAGGRRELVKRYHPDRFADPQQRKRAERLTAEINAAHDAVERHLTRGK